MIFGQFGFLCHGYLTAQRNHNKHYTCSLSLWRVVRGRKLMHLDSLIHGLFITKTQFRLSTTFILYRAIFIYIRTTGNSFRHLHASLCAHLGLEYMWRFPLALFPLANSLLLPFLSPLYLIGNPPCCDRILSTSVPGCL